jgi:hypothetical protein
MTAKKRQHRATSKAAHDSIKEHKEVMYEKITIGLRILKVGGTYEQIAEAAGIRPDQCCKRLPEMIEAGTVYNVGTTRATSSGRQAMVRQLVEIKIEQSKEPVIPRKILRQSQLFK